MMSCQMSPNVPQLFPQSQQNITIDHPNILRLGLRYYNVLHGKHPDSQITKEATLVSHCRNSWAKQIVIKSTYQECLYKTNLF